MHLSMSITISVAVLKRFAGLTAILISIGIAAVTLIRDYHTDPDSLTTAGVIAGLIVLLATGTKSFLFYVSALAIVSAALLAVANGPLLTIETAALILLLYESAMLAVIGFFIIKNS